MSREPSSAAHRYNEAIGRSGGYEPPAPPPKPEPAPPKPGKGRNLRIRVEPEKAKPQRRDEVVGLVSKLATTTEALTADEKALMREYREIHQIERAWRAKKERDR